MSVNRPRAKDGTFKSEFYHFDFTLKGHRFHGSTGKTSRREAEKAEQHERHKRRQAIEASQGGRMTLDVAEYHYWNDRAQHSVNAKVTETHIRWLIEWFGANTFIDEITTADVQGLIAKRRTEVAPATVNRHSTELLRRIFKRVEKVHRITPHNPPDWAELRLPEPKERIRELSTDEEMRLMVAIRADYRPVLAFSLLTGLRQNEVLQLKWSQIDEAQSTMRIWVKGGYWRSIKVAASMWAIIAPLRDHHPEFVFTYIQQSRRRGLPKGTRIPINKDSLKRVWKYALKEAKIEDYCWHDNRHTALTRLVRTTGSLKTAQILAGHHDISTTARYAHATKDDVADALDRVARRAIDINHRKNHRNRSQFYWIAQENQRLTSLRSPTPQAIALPDCAMLRLSVCLDVTATLINQRMLLK